jgi:chromosome segregation ATPase
MKGTIRIIWLGILASAVMIGQEPAPDSLAVAGQAAGKRISEWTTLSQRMEARLARLLPCDPQARDTIDEVNRASQARMTAIAQYLQAAAAKAKDETEAAKRLLDKQAAMAADFEVDITEARQERAALENQTDTLNASLKQRASLADAQKALAGIVEGARRRAAQAADRSGRVQELGATLRELVAMHEARQAALEAELSALATEDVRWGTYYAARMARAQAECTITNPGATPRPQRPAQKRNP